MKIQSKAIIFFLLFMVVLGMKKEAAGMTFFDNFDSYSDEASVEAAGWGLDYTTLESTGCREGKCLKADITATGTLWYIMHELNEAEPYIRFYSKRVGFDGSGGNKFLKLFGENTGNNYANITYGQEYTNGVFNQVNTGDGLGAENDTQCNWYWYSHSLPCTGVVDYVDETFIMEDNQWYAFEVYVYPNTNSSYDGEIKVWVNGALRLSYSGLKMRNDLNVRNFTDLSFVNYAGGTLAGPYEMWFDDVVVSNSYTGPVDSGDTTPPGDPRGLTVN